MAWEFRRPLFDLQGALVVGIGSGDTQIRSSRFTSLPTDYSTGSYLPLTITDDAGSEVVWVTGHSTASDGVTVTRGREGTTARAFDPTAIVRCTPTLRDVVSTVATRAALPSDAHYGCRVLIINEGQVVERTSAGWNDSAPLEDDPTRQHHWILTGAPLSTGSLITIAGWAAAGNHTGTVATLQGNSQFLLNRPGLWSLKIAAYGSNAASRNQGVAMDWPSGAFLAKPYQIVGVIGGAGTAGNGLIETVWTGYVDATQAAAPIICQAWSTVALSGCQYDFMAEYLGR